MIRLACVTGWSFVSCWLRSVRARQPSGLLLPLDGDCKLVHVDGASMPADFLTKRVEQKKVDQSVAYATNARNAVPQHEARSLHVPHSRQRARLSGVRGRVRRDGKETD